MNSRSICSVR